MNNTKNQFADLLDEIGFHVTELHRLNCVIVHNPTKKPIVKDCFGVDRPVIQFFDSDSLAKKKILCVQATVRARTYYDNYSAKMELELKKIPDPDSKQLNQNLKDSAALNARIKYTMDGEDVEDD